MARQTPRSSGSTAKPASSACDDAWALGFRTCGDPKLVGLLDAVRAFRAALLADEKPGRWLSMLGTSGNGKSHLARALWESARVTPWWNPSATDYVPRFLFWPDFIDKLRGGDWFGVFDDAKRWPVLVLDEIRCNRDPTGFATDRLSTLLGCRTGRWTVLTGNLTFEEVEEMDVRIASRMRRDGGVVVECTAMDYALRPRR